MTKEEEIAMLQSMVTRHMEDKNYRIATKYLCLIEEIEEIEEPPCTGS